LHDTNNLLDIILNKYKNKDGLEMLGVKLHHVVMVAKLKVLEL